MKNLNRFGFFWYYWVTSAANEDQFTMSEKTPLKLDEMETSLALHALRFYMNAKGLEISDNTKRLEAKFDAYLSDTTFVVSEVENVFSILGSRGGTKGGASTSEAKRAAAAANGAKGGRPHKPNLFIKFAKTVWVEPDPTLLNELYKLVGTNTWLPDEDDNARSGPYVRIYVPEVSKKLEKLLGNSLNVFEWDDKPFFRLCAEHKNELCRAITKEEIERQGKCNSGCDSPAEWIY